MKKIFFVIVPVLIVAGLLIGVSKIFAQTQEPVVSYACEGKSGLLMAVGDDWSQKSECSENQRLVRIGNQGPNGVGNILFIYKPPGDPIFVLTADGKIYKQTGSSGWFGAANSTYPGSLPPEVPATNVAQWMVIHFLDKDGNVWWWNRGNSTWVNVGHP